MVCVFCFVAIVDVSHASVSKLDVASIIAEIQHSTKINSVDGGMYSIEIICGASSFFFAPTLKSSMWFFIRS
jgi:hypothetical protein